VEGCEFYPDRCLFFPRKIMLSDSHLHRHPPLIPYPDKVTRFSRAATPRFMNFYQKNSFLKQLCPAKGGIA
jgi:hypothetical protein